MHHSLQRAGLEFEDVVTWEQVPMKQEDGTVQLQSWPVILPHALVPRLNSCFAKISGHA